MDKRPFRAPNPAFLGRLAETNESLREKLGRVERLMALADKTTDLEEAERLINEGEEIIRQMNGTFKTFDASFKNEFTALERAIAEHKQLGDAQ